MRKLFLALVLVVAACHHDPEPLHAKDMPPLPPSSGTPIGYLLDSASDLKLDDNQVTKLRDLDASLAAEDADIDTQLRQIERPEAEEPTPKGEKPRRHNNAPGIGMHTTADAGKLHTMRDRQDQQALTKAFAVLDTTQQSSARKLLEERGVSAPGGVQKPTHGGAEEDGQPLPEPGMGEP